MKTRKNKTPLSQTRLAARLGISQQRVSKLAAMDDWQWGIAPWSESDVPAIIEWLDLKREGSNYGRSLDTPAARHQDDTAQMRERDRLLGLACAHHTLTVAGVDDATYERTIDRVSKWLSDPTAKSSTPKRDKAAVTAKAPGQPCVCSGNRCQCVRRSKPPSDRTRH